METETSNAVLFGLLGAGSALIFSSIGAAYGSAKAASFTLTEESSDLNINSLDEENSLTDKCSKNKFSKSTFLSFIPIIIAGVLAIYGLIYSVIVLSSVTSETYSQTQGYYQFVGGLTVGLSCLASGIAVGIVGKNGLISLSKNNSTGIRMVINLVYCEALGLYGLIFGLIAVSY